ncbi:MAG: hypothetical protein WKF96_02520 [Solirubrobacteraceae bacterium]
MSTAEGPAFKPLPVLATTVLASLGSAAPWLWVLLARAGAIAALVLAFRLARDLAGGSAGAGFMAAVGVMVTGAYVEFGAAGMSEGLLLALALGATQAWRSERPRLALACALACGLIRVEAWPFLLGAAALAWRKRPQDRPLYAAAAAVVPALWFVPELIGSGDLLRSGSRARIPNPGQPALADFPFWASLREAVALVPWPLWIGTLAAALTSRRALFPAAAGAVWILLVAVMAQAGFSGEARYALPGAALIAVSGAAGLALAARRAIQPVSRTSWIAHGAVVAVVLAALVLPNAARIADVREDQAYQWRLQHDLDTAIDRAGGRAAVLGCGTPHVGPLRGPLFAYALDVPKRTVEPDAAPEAPGTVFRSSLTRSSEPEPAVVPNGFVPSARAGPWEVFSSCS